MEGAELTLEKAMRIARTYETSQAQLKTMSAENKEERIHIIKQRTQDGYNQRLKEPILSQGQIYYQQTTTQCGNCDRRHNRSENAQQKDNSVAHVENPTILHKYVDPKD